MNKKTLFSHSFIPLNYVSSLPRPTLSFTHTLWTSLRFVMSIFAA